MDCIFCSLKSTGVVNNTEYLIGDDGWTSLYAAKDKDNKLYIYASGETITSWYYPKYCPECGRKINDGELKERID